MPMTASNEGFWVVNCHTT